MNVEKKILTYNNFMTISFLVRKMKNIMQSIKNNSKLISDILQSSENPMES